MYYEDRNTGSIFSIREVAATAKLHRVGLEEIARGLKRLPPSTVMLIEEAETIAVLAEQQVEREWFEGLLG